MVKQYKVVGPCPVADVEPGGMVSQAELDAARAQVDFLLGIHLEEVQPAAAAKPKPEAKAS